MCFRFERCRTLVQVRYPYTAYSRHRCSLGMFEITCMSTGLPCMTMSIVKLNKLQHMPENMSNEFEIANRDQQNSSIILVIYNYIFQFGKPIDSKDY